MVTVSLDLFGGQEQGPARYIVPIAGMGILGFVLYKILDRPPAQTMYFGEVKGPKGSNRISDE